MASSSSSKVSKDIIDRLYNSKSKPSTICYAPSQHDPITGARLFEPQINKSTASTRSNSIYSNSNNDSSYNSQEYTKVEDRLTEYDRYKESRALRRASIEEMRINNLVNKPKVNATSLKLLKRREELTGTSQSRIHLPINNIKESTIKNIQELMPFKPTLIASQFNEGIRQSSRVNSSSNSSYIDHTNPANRFTDTEGAAAATEFLNTSDQMYARSQQWKKQRDDKVYRERIQIEKKMAEELTFKPALSEIAPASSSLCSKNKSLDSTLSLSERQMMWMQKRDEKLEVERRRKDIADLQECSFIPNKRVSSSPPPPPPMLLSPSVPSPSSLHNYMVSQNNSSSSSNSNTSAEVDGLDGYDPIHDYINDIQQYEISNEDDFNKEYENFLQHSDAYDSIGGYTGDSLSSYVFDLHIDENSIDLATLAKM